jgi:hypothetical protein
MTAIVRLVLEGLEVTHRELDGTDYTGVVYAERYGEAKSVFKRLADELGIDVKKGVG